jgi:nicotinate-nucleotide adenylyltransferase
VGHLYLARLALEAAGLDRVLFVPAARPPHKPEGPRASDTHRLAMLEAAVTPEPGFAVSRIELEPGGPRYTADTLARLAAASPGEELRFLLGWDSLLDLPGWRNPDAILDDHGVVAVDRPGSGGDPPDSLAGHPGVTLVRGNPFAVSATLVRRRLAAGLSVRHLVPDAVADYLALHRPYEEA